MVRKPAVNTLYLLCFAKQTISSRPNPDPNLSFLFFSSSPPHPPLTPTLLPHPRSSHTHPPLSLRTGGTLVLCRGQQRSLYSTEYFTTSIDKLAFVTRNCILHVNRFFFFYSFFLFFFCVLSKGGAAAGVLLISSVTFMLVRALVFLLSDASLPSVGGRAGGLLGQRSPE